MRDIDKLTDTYRMSLQDIARATNLAAPLLNRHRNEDHDLDQHDSRMAADASMALRLTLDNLVQAGIQDPGRWMLAPLVEGYTVCPADLMRFGQVEAIYQMAFGKDPATILDLAHGCWRECQSPAGEARTVTLQSLGRGGDE